MSWVGVGLGLGYYCNGGDAADDDDDDDNDDAVVGFVHCKDTAS